MAEDILVNGAGELLNKLISKAIDEIVLMKGVKKEVKKLEEVARKIQQVLEDAEKKQVDDVGVRLWLSDLKEVAYAADDVLDEIAYESLRQQVESKSRIKGKVRDFFTPSNPLAFRLEMAHKIKEINQRLDQIANEKGRFKFDVNPVLAPAESSQGSTLNRETASFVTDSEIVGRNDDKSKIINMLLQKVNIEDDIISVIPIVGFGGLGKTTLAQLVYNDVEIGKKFDLKMWVWVSNNFDVKRVIREMIESISKQKFEVSSMDVMQNSLRGELEGKTFLLVLDDMWVEEHFLEKWDTLNTLLRCANQGSKVVVTTRNREVASIVGTLQTFDLQILPIDDCWELFERRAFSARRPKKTPELESIGKEIMKKCAGVPLALKTLGGLMQSKHQENEWLDIQNSPIWDISDADKKIMNVLKLSFESLAPPIKQCLLYCSIFSKGYRIKKEYLIQLWMAEGFLGSSRGSKTMEDTGNAYFDILCSNSLLQDIEKNKFGEIIGCEMHDLVHDLVTSISGSECLIVDSDDISRDVSKTHWLVCNFDESRIPQSLYKAKISRTFYTWNEFEVHDEDFGKLLLNFKSLRVLDLSFTIITQLPSSIGKLKHLRFLNISNTGVEKLPKSISRLYNLQTLRMENCENLSELPEEIGKLINLRHLVIDLSGEWDGMPKGIGQLKCLQTLPVFQVGRNDDGHTLAELEHLNFLRGKLEIYDLDVVEDAKYAKAANLKAKGEIHSLHLEWDRDEEDDLNVDNVNDNDVLEALQPHSNLKKLVIREFSGAEFPRWIASGSMLGCLTKVSINECNYCVYLPSLGQLPSLKKVTVHGMANVKQIGGAWNGWPSNNNADIEVAENTMTTVAFPSLEELYLAAMPNLEEWLLEPTSSSFPRLESLTIMNCPEVKITPSSFPSLNFLMIGLSSAITIQALTKNLTSLTSLAICDCPDVKFLPTEILSKNKFLEDVTIESCQEFEGFVSQEDNHNYGEVEPDGSCHPILTTRIDEKMFSALKELRINYCPKFHMIPIPNTLPSLNTLAIQDSSAGLMKRLTSNLTTLTYLWIEKIPDLVFLPNALLKNNTLLEKLSICGCPSLENFLHANENKLESLSHLTVRDCPRLTSLELQGLAFLRHVEIVNCGGIKSLPEKSALLPQLEKLRIGISEELHCFPFPEATQQYHFPSLGGLQIEGSPKMQSLPYQLQYLTKLKILIILKFDGLIDLPEWLGNLTMLNKIKISKCQNLIHLPSMKAMQRLTSLHYLSIEDCPLLTEILNGESGHEEWEKVSHILIINIDGRIYSNTKGSVNISLLGS